jgi:chemotaxis signal transduction protein
VISGTGRGALAIFFASHESSFKVPSIVITMAAHRVLGLTAERASHVRKCPRCNATPSESRGSTRSSSTVSGTFMSGARLRLPGSLALGAQHGKFDAVLLRYG